MSEELKYSFYTWMYKKEKNRNVLVTILIVILFIIILFSFYYSLENKKIVNAETICENNICTLNFYQNIEEELKYDFIKIQNSKYEIEDWYVDSVMLDSSNNAYQKVALKVKEYEGKDKAIVKLQLIKNKEKLLKKILNIIFER